MVSKKCDHYFALFSRVCCRKHHWGTVFVHALLLPLGQQMATLIYSHWIKTFVGFWQSKNAEMIANLPSKNDDCIKHCEDDTAEGELEKNPMYYNQLMSYDSPLGAFEGWVILEVASFKEEGLVTLEG